MRMPFVEALVCLVAVLHHIDAFNLDTEHFTRHGAPGQRPAMFGFAVASHIERGQPWVMVGAPEAQTSQPGVDRGGAVYRCDPTRDDACAEVPFDRTGNNNDSIGIQIDKKSHQWFGATLSSAGEDGPIIACAPRYVSFAVKNTRRDPVGTCYVSRNGFSETLEFAPCRTRNWGYHRQGSCQAGLGASISKDGRRVFIGAPGSWYWQGQMYSVNPSIRLPFMPPRYKGYGEGQLYSQSVDNRPSVLATGESAASYDDSYLGYSVVVGDFSGSGEQGVAVGMPRGANLLGKVVLYSWDLQNIHNLTGEQIGGYFGYSLCSTDVDGDGLDDLIVGAPMYTPINKEGNYDVGRIYVIYHNSPEGRYRKIHIRDGTMSKSRFGLSLASLGDINLDAFGDFAVGAPYDGVNNRGAVYIYHGSSNGVREKPSQIIRAEDTYYSTLTTFGFSLAGGVDLDSNEYNDLVVGAYEADTTFLFRAKPVVKMTASILFGTDSKLISLDDKNCTLTNRRKVACTTINYCLTYDGIGVDTLVDFDLQFILDTKKANDPRLYFSEQEGRHMLNQTIPLVRNKMYCNSMLVYIVPNIRDKLTPIEAEVRYSMREDPSVASAASSNAGRRRNPRSVLRPVLDLNVPNVQKDSINIQKNCGSDNVCIPDLRMIATPNVDKYLLGSKERLVIDVIVQNMGEDAFEATYDLKVPAGMNYIKIERIDKAGAEIPVQCSPPTSFNNYTLKCDIGNPLPQGRLVHFKVLLEPYHKTGMAPSYELFMETNSTNPEAANSLADNQQSMSIGIWLETDLVITGTSYPPDLHYNTSSYKEGNYTHETDIGPQLVHLYGIRNNGPSTIEEAEIILLWPYETLAGDSLMYVLEQPETSGNIKCELAEHINDFHLIVDSKRKSYLDSALQGGKVSGSAMSGVGMAGGGMSGGGISGSSAQGATSGASWSSSSSSGSSGGGSWSSSRNKTWSSSSSGGRVLTEEHKKRIDDEEKRFGVATGDGSQIHVQRAQQAHSSEGQWVSGGSGSYFERDGGYSKNYTTSGGSQQGTIGAGGAATNHGQYNGRTAWTLNSGTQGGDAGGWNQQGGQSQGGYGSGRNEGQFSASGSQNTGAVHTTRNRTYTSSGGQGWAAGSGQQSGGAQWDGNQGRRVQDGSVTYTGSVQSGGSQGGRSYESHGSSGTVSSQYGGSQGTMVEGGRSYESHGSSGTVSSQHGGSQGTMVEGGRSYDSQSGAGSTAMHGGGAQGSVRQGGWSHERDGSQYGGIQGSGNDNRGQVIWYEKKPVETYNKTYTTTWNTTYDRSGNPVVHKSSWNSTSRMGADGRIISTDTSTELYNVGSEGIAGSSFNNRIDGGSQYERNFHTRMESSQGGSRGYEESGNIRGDGGSRVSGGSGGSVREYVQGEENQGQGGSTTYGAGHYTSGGARRYQISDGKYVAPASHNWGEGSDNFISASGRHKWSTEETVNKDLIHAGSATFHHDGSRISHGEASNTYVGQPQKPIGLGEAAMGQGYRVNTWDLGAIATQKGEQKEGASRNSGAQSYSSSYHTQWSSADTRDDVVTDRPHEHFRWDRQARNKRQIDREDAATAIQRHRQTMMERNEQQLAEASQCPGLKCARVRCVAGPMDTKHEIWVAIRSRVNAQTLKKLTYDQSVTLTSVAVARVSRLPYLGEPLERTPHAQQASSILTPLPPPQLAEPVPLWVVVLSACAGAALLLLLIYALYKCGFFKRNRPSDAPERQPLNRNGYGQDEQL